MFSIGSHSQNDMTELISALDSARFGFAVARVDDVAHIKQKDFIQSLREQSVKLVLSRVPAESIEDINFLENIGFRVMDIQSTYRFDLINDRIDPSDRIPGVTIRSAVNDDIAELRAVSKDSFKGYGHYFADPFLDKAACMEIYPDWISNSVTKNEFADKVFVAAIGGKISGFLTFKIFKENNDKFAAGGIGAVASRYRGRNVFTSLVSEGLEWGRSLGFLWEEHDVLTTNYPVNRVFSKLGFKITASSVTLHYWIDKDGSSSLL